MTSRIEQMITEIEDLIERSKRLPLSSNSIVVNKDEIQELLAELRLRTPEEIKKYQKIITNREAILTEARERAENMIKQATAQTNELVSEHEIMQQAYVQANEIVQNASKQAKEILDAATTEANEVRTSAMAYVDGILSNVQNAITYQIQDISIKYDNYIKSLNSSLDIVIENRKELNPSDEINTDLLKDVPENQMPSDDEFDSEFEDDGFGESDADNANFQDYTVELDDLKL